LGQTQILKDYDFNEGGYYILGTYSESDRSGLRDSIGEFYTNDTSILNQIKSDWVFSIPGKKYACGYHYNVFVCKNGVVLESFRINLNCDEIVTDEGYFYFHSDKLRKYYGIFKKPYRKSEDFENINSAREYRDSILKNENLIMTPTPRWTKFEGEFDFTYKCDENKKTCFEKEDSLKVVIENKIRKTYPDEEFELSDRGGSWTTIDQIVYCNKSLSDKFDLFYRDDGYFGEWRPFRLSLTTYWIRR
jgi:hypothetical protein